MIIGCDSAFGRCDYTASPIEPEHARLAAAGLARGAIERTEDYFILRLRDPDGNLVVLASAERC